MNMLGDLWKIMGRKYKKRAEHLQSRGSFQKVLTVGEKKSAGEQIRLARLAAGIDSAEKLADLIGVDKNTVYAWENGHRLPYTLPLKGLYTILGMSIDRLIGGDGDDGAESARLLTAEVRGHLSTGRYDKARDVALLGSDSTEKREVFEFPRRLLGGEVLGSVFWVRVSGEGLAPDFRQGNLLLFEAVAGWRACGDGALVLARFSGRGGQAVLKRYRKGLKILEGLRVSLATERIGKGVEAVGVLVGVWRDCS